jgi:DNA topoisomerase IA
MGKTLVIAEKPSVAAEYAKALGDGFQNHEGFLESGTHIVSWARGHQWAWLNRRTRDFDAGQWPSCQFCPTRSAYYLNRAEAISWGSYLSDEALRRRHDHQRLRCGTRG